MYSLKHVFPMILIVLLPFLSHPQKNETAAAELVLASNGTAHYVIYYGAGESEIVEHAALELGQRLDEITGATFSVTTDETVSQPKIVVGRNNPLTIAIADQIDFPAIEGDGFRILTHDSNLYIVGAIDRGTMYGVYHLLDIYFGVRWFSPEFEVTPTQSTLSIEEVNDLQNPRFSYREIFSGDTDDAYFRQHNRLNGNRGETHRQDLDYPTEIDTWSQDGPSGGHNFHDIIGSVYHSGGQIEAMNPAVRSQAASYFISKITDDGDAPWYGFAQEDRGWDADEDSQDFADAHGGALSAPIVDMVIDVTEQVRDTHPNAHLSTIAYQWSFKPPTGMTVPEYVMIETAPIEANFGYPYSDTVKNGATNEAFIGWNDIASTLGVWDYNANFQNYLQPLPNLYPMFSNIQYFAGMESFQSYFGEGAYNTSGAEFAELRAWVAARLLWNPNQDYHALIDEFCDGYYGPEASPFIKQYIALLQQSLTDSGDRISSKQRITSDYLNLDFIRQADQLLASADAVATGAYADHVHEVRLGVDMTILLREHMYAAEAQERGIPWTHDPDRRSRFEQYINAAGITEYGEDATIDQLFTAIDIERVNPPTPDFIVPGSEWIDFQDLDFSYCCGASMVEDTLASDHGVVQLDNEEWAITLPLDVLPPENSWVLYAYVRVDVKPNASPDAEAFNMGVYPGSWISPSVAEMQDGEYHLFQFPEMPVSYQTGRDVWFSADPDNVDNMYVDRIIAVNTAAPAPTLTLFATPADETLQLRWTVGGTIPVTSTWQIDYASETGSTYLPVTIDTADTRAHTLGGLTNGVWYTVTLRAMLDDSPFLTDTVSAMPVDNFVYLPLVLKE